MSEKNSAVMGRPEVDSRFKLMVGYDVVVPRRYDHATCLEKFRKKYRKDFHHYNAGITDENFGRATTRIAHGQRFHVEIFQIKERLTSDECITFLHSQGAVLVGAQGATLMYEQYSKHLPKDQWMVSFDEKEALWKDGDSQHKVPCICHAMGIRDDHPGTGFEFRLSRFDGDWHGGTCLFCFTTI